MAAAPNPYAAGAAIPVPPPPPAPLRTFAHGAIVPATHLSGNKLVNPPGWEPCLMWDGKVTSYFSERLKRRAEVPNLYFVDLFWDYQQHRDSRYADPPWVHASQLPEELRDAIIDYYGEDDLTPTQQLICADRLLARRIDRERDRVREARRAPVTEVTRPARRRASSGAKKRRKAT